METTKSKRKVAVIGSGVGLGERLDKPTPIPTVNRFPEETTPVETVSEQKKIRDLDVISHPEFKKQIVKIVNELVLKRIARSEPKKGYHYKRNWIDQLIDSNQFNPDFFLDNALAALMRQSPLPASLRQPVLDVALTAFFQTKDLIQNEQLS